MAKLSPVFNDTQLDNSGNLLVGGLIYTYAAGSTTPLATYTSSSSAVAQANPIVLNARGEVASPIWLTEGLLYKLRLFDSSNNFIREFDNVAGVGDTSITVEQWIVSGIAPTYVSATQFTLPGDQTSAFQVGRRVKATVTAGTVYGTISVSAFAALTTVTLVMDAGQVLDSGLSAVSYGIITTSPNSLPFSLSASAIQAQTYTAFTTAGTSSAFTLTPTPVITANVANQAFFVKLNAAPTGSPTLAVSGQTALNFKYYDANGVKQFITSAVAPINWQSFVWNDGTDWVMINTLPNLATNTSYTTGTATNELLTTAVARARNLVAGTAVATTSGTSIDFTGIPSWVKRITVMLSGVSTNGTSAFILQIGDSGGIETTGYLSGSSVLTSIVSTINATTGMLLDSGTSAASLQSGQAILTLLDASTNTWTYSSFIFFDGNTQTQVCGGRKSLSPGPLDRIRLTTLAGTDTFDAGSMNIIYE